MSAGLSPRTPRGDSNHPGPTGREGARPEQRGCPANRTEWLLSSTPARAQRLLRMTIRRVQKVQGLGAQPPP